MRSPFGEMFLGMADGSATSIGGANGLGKEAGGPNCRTGLADMGSYLGHPDFAVVGVAAGAVALEIAAWYVKRRGTAQPE